MIKKVRIVNADIGKEKLRVQVFFKTPGDGADRLEATYHLNNPADLHEITLWHDRYAVISLREDA